MWTRHFDWLRKFLESNHVDTEALATERAALARAHEELQARHRAVLDRLEARCLQLSRLREEAEKLKARYEHLQAECDRLRSSNGRVHRAELDKPSPETSHGPATRKTISPHEHQQPADTDTTTYYGVLWRKRRRSNLVACCPVCSTPLNVLFPRSREDRLHCCASCGFVAVELIGVPLAVVKRELKRRFSTNGRRLTQQESLQREPPGVHAKQR